MDQTDSNAQGAAQELQVLAAILNALNDLSSERRQRVLQTVATYFSDETPRLTAFSSSQSTAGRAYEPTFSENRAISSKEFILQKQPRTDIERVACLAYYLTHYSNTPHFKTLDISKLNTDAAQLKFANAANAVENATKGGFLVPASKGTKQLSAAGELYVQALPDRDAAKAAMQSALRPRRKGNKQRGIVAESEQASAPEGNQA